MTHHQPSPGPPADLGGAWRRAWIRALTGTVVLALGGFAVLGVLAQAETVDLSGFQLVPWPLLLGL